ncbi:unnamed protein product, partial [Amoebophrya sp. A120]|eukprot:GSA120T00016036001.1
MTQSSPRRRAAVGTCPVRTRRHPCTKSIEYDASGAIQYRHDCAGRASWLPMTRAQVPQLGKSPPPTVARVLAEHLRGLWKLELASGLLGKGRKPMERVHICPGPQRARLWMLPRRRVACSGRKRAATSLCARGVSVAAWPPGSRNWSAPEFSARMAPRAFPAAPAPVYSGPAAGLRCLLCAGRFVRAGQRRAGRAGSAPGRVHNARPCRSRLRSSRASRPRPRLTDPGPTFVKSTPVAFGSKKRASKPVAWPFSN